MRTFLLKLSILTIFATVLIGVSWWRLEAGIQQRYARGYTHDLSWAVRVARLFQANAGADVIFAGDARVATALNPDIFRADGVPAVNLSSPGEDLLGFVTFMEEMQFNLKERIYVIGVSSNQINESEIDPDTLGVEQFHALTSLERIRLLKTNWFRAARRLGLGMDWSPQNFQRAVLSATLLPSESSGSGYVAVDKIFPQHCILTWPRPRMANFNGARVRTLELAIDRLSKWPGHVYLFNPPLNPNFRDCVAGTARETDEQRFSELMARAVLGKDRMSFSNLATVPREILSSADFADNYHLNSIGAEKFTRSWLSEIRRSGLLPERMPAGSNQ